MSKEIQLSQRAAQDVLQSLDGPHWKVFLNFCELYKTSLSEEVQSPPSGIASFFEREQALGFITLHSRMLEEYKNHITEIANTPDEDT